MQDEEREKINKRICKILSEIAIELKGKTSTRSLAFESDIPRSVLIYILEGKRDPQLTTFMRLANGLNLKPSELMRIIEEKLGNEFEF